MQANKIVRTLAIVIALTAMLGTAGPAPAKDTLTLRVNDAIGAPNGLTAVVIRTYASRPVGQGQICLGTGGGSLARSAGAVAELPFAELVDAVVFAKRRDAVSVAALELNGQGQEVVLTFSSDSGTINRSDGPLAVLYFRLESGLRPGQTFELSIDPERTALFDAAGNPIAFEPRAGELTVRADSAPYAVEAEGDKISPGSVAELGVETYEPFAIGSGQIGFRYDDAIAAGRAKVKMSKKHGTRRFSVDRSTPGLLLVSFSSPQNDLNLVPGELISVNLPTRADLSVGSRSRVQIDPALSFLAGPEGEPLAAEFESGRVRFRRDGGGSGGDGSGDDMDDDGEKNEDGDSDEDDSDGPDDDSDDD